ncbi:Inositol-phosphate phosphatase [Gloeomargarita lithophora Alchichica-D10]|uniref:inositol-phosphate phosphatase n=1 Tax=Gloeomargarita lithophora Alchichica-D10 TaxID=1188229 RepID=A0A1J0AFI6_9CYAN|nr:3'(2'),5'-bisphosphate nucleotidase CysQ [Gloeomargarita lithophora]APB34698.1 Inositol-phosphate phosphatase [Gloeomargarita lithophora Alchichica-D10]
MVRELAVLESALRQAGAAVCQVVETGLKTTYKTGDDPLTEADLAANRVLQAALLGAFPTDGWLSEETQDQPQRLGQQRVWVVDPIDGTRELVQGIPEYALSVALVVDGQPCLGGVYNPAQEELFLGQIGAGVTCNGLPVGAGHPLGAMPVVLASRSEVRRGTWQRFEGQMTIRVVGSIAYKLAQVAAGRADATFSLSPKHEWDVAGGVALVLAAGGVVITAAGQALEFNQMPPLLPSILATTPAAEAIMRQIIGTALG